jgi:sirohydrochlorin cobaltochelatase
MTQGLILFAHGARDPRWATPFEDMAQRVRLLRPALHVRLAFLEFMTPDLSGAAADLVAAGCRRVDLLPVFLGSGGHVRKDLPLLLDALRQRHADTQFALHGAIGEMPAVLQAMADAAVSVTAGPLEGASPR